jgi:DUF971 family protein
MAAKLTSKSILKKVHLHRQSKRLELLVDEVSYQLSAEYLRVHSPSAEVRGHGPGQGKLPSGKINVGINNLRAVGNYGLRIEFDDGHNSGIYTWSYLTELCLGRDKKWQNYLTQLRREGKHRDPDTQVIQFTPPK